MDERVIFSTDLRLTPEQERLIRSLTPEQLRRLEQDVADAVNAAAERILLEILTREPKSSERRPVGFLNFNGT